MASLVEIVKDPARRKQVVDATVQLIDAEVARKGGVSGLAIKGSYKMVNSLRPGMVGMAMDGLLDDFAGKIDPFWAECQSTGAEPKAFFTKRQTEIANALLGITDDRARKTPHKTLKKAYEKLRPQGVQHIGDAMPAFAELLKKHAS